MNTVKVLSSKQLARAVRGTTFSTRTWVRAMSSEYHKVPANFKHFHFDYMPVPQGSWQEAYDRDQKKNNAMLLSGFVAFVVSVIAITQSGIVHFNATLPPLPECEE